MLQAPTFENGYIFVCTDHTESECFSSGKFEAPESEWDHVTKIREGTAIFLFKNVHDHPILYGVFLADGTPQKVVKSVALGGRFSVQIRVKQYYKFSPLPWTTFMKLFDGKTKAKNIGLQITREQTLNLITKFIIITRLFLGRRLKFKLEAIEIDNDWAKRMLMFLDYCDNWLTRKMKMVKPGFQFTPALMQQPGNLNDFIFAIRAVKNEKSTGKVKNKRSIIKFLHQGYGDFLKIVSNVNARNSIVRNSRKYSDPMIEVLSILSQVTSRQGPCNILDSSQIDARKRWSRFEQNPLYVLRKSSQAQTFVKGEGKHTRTKFVYPQHPFEMLSHPHCMYDYQPEGQQPFSKNIYENSKLIESSIIPFHSSCRDIFQRNRRDKINQHLRRSCVKGAVKRPFTRRSQFISDSRYSSQYLEGCSCLEDATAKHVNIVYKLTKYKNALEKLPSF